MKLHELKTQIDAIMINKRHHDDEVMIVVNEPSIGARSMVAVKGASFGFDWEAHRFIITPAEPIVRKRGAR